MAPEEKRRRAEEHEQFIDSHPVFKDEANRLFAVVYPYKNARNRKQIPLIPLYRSAWDWLKEGEEVPLKASQAWVYPSELTIPVEVLHRNLLASYHERVNCAMRRQATRIKATKGGTSC